MNSGTRRLVLGQLLLAGGALAAVAAPAALAEAAADVDPHLAWAAEARRILALLDGPERPGIDDTDDGYHAELEAAFDLQELVAATPAATFGGIQEQVRLALYCAETWPGDRNEPVVAALQNAGASLEALAGGRA